MKTIRNFFTVSFAFFFKWVKDVVVFLKKEKNNRTQFYHFKSKQMFFSDQKTSEYYFRYTYSMYIVEQKTADQECKKYEKKENSMMGMRTIAENVLGQFSNF